MKTIMVGIGDYKISRSKTSEIKTMALGSCVGVTFYYPDENLGAMIHIALPDSRLNKVRASEKPAYFADTGLQLLLNRFKSYIANFDKKRLIIKMAGGASIMDSNKTFNIGYRNIEAVKNIFGRKGYNIASSDIGDQISRTITLEMKTGHLKISSPTRGIWRI